jgi:hypothetical protein
MNGLLRNQSICWNKMLRACSAFQYPLSWHLRSPQATVPKIFHEIVPEMKPTDPLARAKLADLLYAFEFVSADRSYGHEAYMKMGVRGISVFQGNNALPWWARKCRITLTRFSTFQGITTTDGRVA